MCRLFAFLSPSTSTVRGLLGDAGMERFVSLARLHGDGWGWAGVDKPDEAPVVRKSARSAIDDPAFEKAMTTEARAAMVHLRWATSGLPIADRNAHPFQAGDLAFEHNGSLKPIERARELLSVEALAGMTGDTDSEMYFTLVREQLALGLPLHEATVRVVRRLREAFPLSSLNAILLTPEEMIVVRASAHSILSDEDLDEITQHPHLPDEHNEDYFALRWKRHDDGTIVIGSTGVAEYDWEPLPPESVTAIRLSDRTGTTIALHAAAR
jgi:predicted glutamine amidotransferase